MTNWITKDEAAALLGVGKRQVERREAEGFLQKQTQPRKPTQTTATVLYSREDCEALLAGTPNVYGRTVSDTAELVSDRPKAVVESGDPQDWFAGLSGRLARLAAAFPPEPPAPWLTLAEAAAYSGLPKAFLRRRAAGGWPGALDVGKNATGGRWRFNRAALTEGAVTLLSARGLVEESNPQE